MHVTLYVRLNTKICFNFQEIILCWFNDTKLDWIGLLLLYSITIINIYNLKKRGKTQLLILIPRGIYCFCIS